MANAKTDEVEVMQPVMEKRIVLTLTQAEAEYLSALLGFKVIGGGEVRNLNSSIWNALAAEVGDFGLAGTTGQVKMDNTTEVYPYM